MMVKETFINKEGKVLSTQELDPKGGPSRWVSPGLADTVYREGVRKVVVEYESGSRIELERAQ